nr:hypothetical protein [candidate division Zixibacteria bacterium]
MRRTQNTLAIILAAAIGLAGAPAWGMSLPFQWATNPEPVTSLPPGDTLRIGLYVDSLMKAPIGGWLQGVQVNLAYDEDRLHWERMEWTGTLLQNWIRFVGCDSAFGEIAVAAATAKDSIVENGFLLFLVFTNCSSSNVILQPGALPGLLEVETVILNEEHVDPFPVVGVSEPEPPLPAGYALAQNYPNPFNPATTIAFRLAEAGDVAVAVYNAAGQLVRLLR